MKIKLHSFVIVLAIASVLSCNGAYPSSSLDDEQDTRTSKTSFKMPSFKKLFTLGLLASAGLTEAQDLVVPKPYIELSLQPYGVKNYPDGQMPYDPYNLHYQYSSIYGTPSMPNQTSNNVCSISTGGALYSCSLCLIQQQKVVRAYQLRKTANSMYAEIESSSWSPSEKYAAIESAVNVEMASHKLEMDASKFYGATGCPIPPVDL